MTCIATDGKSMAADGRLTDRGTIISDSNVKIERLPDGRLYGSSGDCAGGALIRDWLIADGNSSEFPSPCEETWALVLNHDGTVDQYDQSGRGIPVRVSLPIAIGSGMDVALGAMDAGADPELAVRIAMRRVPTVGGEVTVLKLNP